MMQGLPNAHTPLPPHIQCQILKIAHVISQRIMQTSIHLMGVWLLDIAQQLPQECNNKLGQL